jgi:hypothetical protein
LRWNILHCWLSGFFIGFGFLVHLLLDELYSVDLTNRRMKKSFGTALKLYSYRNKTSSILMLICTLALAWITPQPQPLLKAWLAQKSSHSAISTKKANQDPLG